MAVVDNFSRLNLPIGKMYTKLRVELPVVYLEITRKYKYAVMYCITSGP